MSAYDPPTQNLSIFNPLYFQTNLADLDTTYLNANYLRFPVAQGLENLQKVNITDTTQSTDATSGSLVTAGGIGVARQMHVGGQLHAISGASSTSTTTGALRVTGGVGVSGALFAGGGITGLGSKISALDSTGTYGIILGGSEGTGQKVVYMQYDTTNNRGLIQCIQQGVDYKPILLNPAGGGVLINKSTQISTNNCLETYGISLFTTPTPSPPIKVKDSGSDNGQIHFVANASTGNYNGSVLSGDSIILYNNGMNGTMASSGLNICSWNVGTDGMRFTQSFNFNHSPSGFALKSDGTMSIYFGTFSTNTISSRNLRIFADSGTNVCYLDYYNSINFRNTNSGGVTSGTGATISSAGAYASYSDRRLKKNITDIDYGLNEILKLRPVKYLFNKQEETEKKNLGLIAQEVQPIIREVVETINSEGEEIMTMSYSELIPVLIKAVQEQQTQIVQLQKQNQSLESRLSILEQLVNNKMLE